MEVLGEQVLSPSNMILGSGCVTAMLLYPLDHLTLLHLTSLHLLYLLDHFILLHLTSLHLLYLLDHFILLQFTSLHLLYLLDHFILLQFTSFHLFFPLHFSSPRLTLPYLCSSPLTALIMGHLEYLQLA
ncbi:hypothetical protein Pmani_000272 [Petrolisthes manimaculis]|uniref:Uncharacterized protein n=1 Tax=Petrolisthes manimaculis TaxID=1843537 RepID=A0AAE1USW8_9EUCA|nr:hypothetical protein Pmani_000272 [Petrolisthes manimaculis]